MLKVIDLEKWKKKHPISTKKYPRFWTDCSIDGDTKLSCYTPYTWQSIVRLICERDVGICRICGELGNYNWEKQKWGDEEDWWKYNMDVHHIVSKKEGGSDHPKNLVTICRKKCHNFIHANGGKSFKELVKLLQEQTTLI